MNKRHTPPEDDMDTYAYEDIEHEVFNEGLQGTSEKDLEGDSFNRSEKQPTQRASSPPPSFRPVTSQADVQPARPATTAPAPTILPRQTVKVELPAVLRPKPTPVSPAPSGTPQNSGNSPFGPMIHVPPPPPVLTRYKPPQKQGEHPPVQPTTAANPPAKPVLKVQSHPAPPERTFATSNLLVPEVKEKPAAVPAPYEDKPSPTLEERFANKTWQNEKETLPPAPAPREQEEDIAPPLLSKSEAQPATRTPDDEIASNPFIEHFRGIPDHTAILGICADGLPVLLDLLDDAPGSLLIMGDPGSGKTHLIQSLLRSVTAFTSPEEVSYTLTVSRPSDYQSLASNEHCSGVYDIETESGWGQILQLAAMTEKRYQDKKAGTPVLLVLDDLQNLPRMDAEVRMNLEWLFKYGPTAHVWPLAVLPTQAALRLGRFTSHFRTRVLGCMPDEASRRLGLFNDFQAHSLQHGKEFAVYVNENWMKFSLPFLQNETH